ncbi:hypothetical protein D3C75_660010 [compost metagenome]
MLGAYFSIRSVRSSIAPASTSLLMSVLALIRSGYSPLAAIRATFCCGSPTANSASKVTPVFSVIALPTSSCIPVQFGLGSALKKVIVSGEVSSAVFPVFAAFPAALLPLLPPQPASNPSSITEVSVRADALAFICLLLAMK